MEYSFNIHIASVYGLEEAIMIKNFQFWIIKNQANGKHDHNGSYWTYNSVGSFEKVFPFWSKSQLSRILKSLIDQGALKVGNYNKSKYDRTRWYSFSDTRLLETEQWKDGKPKVEKKKKIKGKQLTDPPIPDVKTYTITNKVEKKIIIEDQDPPLYKQFIEKYWNWIQDQVGVPPMINGQEGKAAKSIIKYLKGISEDPLAAWIFVLKNFDRVEPFLRNQIKLSQINSNLINILNQIKNGKTSDQKSTSGLEAKIRERRSE